MKKINTSHYNLSFADGNNFPVGILLYTGKDHALVEYALAGMDNNLFVSKYQLELPKKEDMQRTLKKHKESILENHSSPIFTRIENAIIEPNHAVHIISTDFPPSHGTVK